VDNITYNFKNQLAQLKTEVIDRLKQLSVNSLEDLRVIVDKIAILASSAHECGQQMPEEIFQWSAGQNQPNLLTLIVKSDDLPLIQKLITRVTSDELSSNPVADQANNNSLAHIIVQHGSLELILSSMSIMGENFGKKNTKEQEPIFLTLARDKGDEIISAVYAKELHEDLRDEKGCNLLLIAAHKGNLPAVKYLIAQGMAQNSEDHNQNNALMYCASGDNPLEMAKFLVESCGLNPRSRNNVSPEQKWTALDYAINHRAFHLVEYLLPLTVNQNDSKTLVECLSATGSEKIWSLLCNHGANLDAKNVQGKSAVKIAYECKRFDCVEFLITKGAYIDEDMQNWQINRLAYYIEKNYTKDFERVFNLLPQNQHNVKSDNGKSLFQLAAEYGRCTLMRLLADSNVSAEGVNVDFKLTYDICTSKIWSDNLMRILDEKGVFAENINKFNEKDETILMRYAIASDRYIGRLEKLIKYGAEVNLANERGETAYSRALFSAKNLPVKILAILQDYDAKINGTFSDGKSYLETAIKQNNYLVIAHLMDEGIPLPEMSDDSLQKILHSTNKDGETLFQIAVKMPGFVAMRTLADLGANSEGVTFSVKLMHDIRAQSEWSTNLMRILEEKGVFFKDINELNEKGETAYSECLFGNRELQPFILDALEKDGANINGTFPDGRSYLQRAVDEKNYEVITFLLKKGCKLPDNVDLNIINKNGQPYLYYACDHLVDEGLLQQGNELIEYIIQNSLESFYVKFDNVKILDHLFKKYKALLKANEPVKLDDLRKVITLIIDYGAKVKYDFQYAVLNLGHWDSKIMHQLLKHGVNGEMILSKAAKNKDFEAIELALQHTAIICKDLKQVIEYCTSTQQMESVTLAPEERQNILSILARNRIEIDSTGSYKYLFLKDLSNDRSIDGALRSVVISKICEFPVDVKVLESDDARENELQKNKLLHKFMNVAYQQEVSSILIKAYCYIKDLWGSPVPAEKNKMDAMKKFIFSYVNNLDQDEKHLIAQGISKALSEYVKKNMLDNAEMREKIITDTDNIMQFLADLACEVSELCGMVENFIKLEGSGVQGKLNGKDKDFDKPDNPQDFINKYAEFSSDYLSFEAACSAILLPSSVTYSPQVILMGGGMQDGDHFACNDD